MTGVVVRKRWFSSAWCRPQSRHLHVGVFSCALAYRIWWRLNPLQFNPINGDFQTYNAASRLLAGQVPFVEFSAYLGLGPTALTAGGLSVLGGDFAASVIGTELLCALAFVFLAQSTFRWAGSSRHLEWAIGLYLVTILAAKVLYGSPFLAVRLLSGALLVPLGLSTSSLVDPGHSLFVLRALWPFVLGWGLVWALRSPTTARIVAFGVVAGSGCVWSPDYGLVSAVVLSLALLFCGARSLAGFSALSASVVISALAAATLVTRGHPLALVDFANGIAQYQDWYFLDDQHKALSVGAILGDTVAFSNLMLICLAAIGAVWLVRAAMASRAPAHVALAAVAVTSVVVGLVTSVKSAFVPYYLAPAATIMLCVGLARIRWGEGRGLLSCNMAQRVWRLAMVVSVPAMAWGAAHIERAAPRGAAQQHLGVSLYDGMPDFEAFVDYVQRRGGRPWSTYATALEAALGVHHPVGPDYIIHALGHKGRARYLEAFVPSDYPVVVTPRPPAVQWEAWSRRANFDFYRRVFSGYGPTANFSHWTVWEPREREAQAPAKCTISRSSDDEVTLHVSGGRASRIVDLSVGFRSFKKPWFLLKGGLRVLVTASDAQLASYGRTGPVVGSYGLPPSSDDWHLPLMTDTNGNGWVSVKAHPAGLVELAVLRCEGRDIAPANYMGG